MNTETAHSMARMDTPFSSLQRLLGQHNMLHAGNRKIYDPHYAVDVATDFIAAQNA